MDKEAKKVLTDEKSVTTEVIPMSKAEPKETLFNYEFIRNFILLLLTASLSGLLVPLISNNIQSRKLQNETILQAQAKLLDDVSNTILTYETLALDVSWYKSHKSIMNLNMHEQAFSRYTDRIVDLFAKWRAEIVKAQNLVSPEMSKKLMDFHKKVLREQDTPITSLYSKNASIEEWASMHQKSENLLVEANKLISDIAIDLKITKSDIK